LPAHAIHPYPHIAWVLCHNDVIVFIQIEHDFLDTKFATYWGTYKTVGFGWLPTYYILQKEGDKRCAICKHPLVSFFRLARWTYAGLTECY
jgi:hypothetical protein